MTSTDDVSAIREINELHKEVVRTTVESRQCLHAALVAAWRAGGLLLHEQQRVHQTMGQVWGEWLAQKFHGTERTAYRYMRLVETVSDISEFQGMSLRQVYFRLGIATEPKCRTNSRPVAHLPAHIRLASRLLVTLKRSPKCRPDDPQQIATLRQDLRALYERLQRLFEPGPPARFPDPSLSGRGQP